MTLALTILGIVSAVIPFVVLLLKQHLEKKQHADTAIGKRDRDELHAGLDRLQGTKPVPTGGSPELRQRR